MADSFAPPTYGNSLPFSLHCPMCRGPLGSGEKGYYCDPCKKEFPLLFGIPDLRVFSDPYSNYEEDYRNSRRIMERYHETDSVGLMEFYLAMKENLRPSLKKHRLAHYSSGVDRGRKSIQAVESKLSGQEPLQFENFLEIGCGTGGFLRAAGERFRNVVGVDLSFTRLLIAKKFLEEERVSALLLGCCGQSLPFPDSRFDLVAASDMIEHTPYQDELFKETHRVLRKRGALFIATPNRFSLKAEPHVLVWGVGFFPRRWADRYVRWVCGTPYTDIRLLSCFELRRMILRSPFGGGEISFPLFSLKNPEDMPPWKRIAEYIFLKVKDLPVIRSFLLLIGPVLHLISVRRD